MYIPIVLYSSESNQSTILVCLFDSLDYPFSKELFQFGITKLIQFSVVGFERHLFNIILWQLLVSVVVKKLFTTQFEWDYGKGLNYPLQRLLV